MKEMGFVDFFWKESVWLPPNMTWKDVQPTKEGIYTEFSDLLYPLPLAVFILILRHFCEKNFFKPLGMALGIKDSKHLKPSTNDVLEKEFHLMEKSREYSINFSQLSRQLNMTERQIQYWLKKRKLYGKPSTLTKFCESGWRWLFYSSAFVYGFVCLWDEAWFNNIRHCWYNYPHHDVPKEIWWYYMIELGFYWSLFFSQFSDVKRKDFVEMFIHHVITISLLCCSWTCNLHRAGSLVLVIHDFADIFLEFAKMANYTKFTTLCDCVFVFFTVSWIVTRLAIFPSWILYSAIVEAPQLVQMFPAYYIFNALLSVLLVLHVIWTYYILKIPYRTLVVKEKIKDSRSDSDLTESEDT